MSRFHLFKCEKFAYRMELKHMHLNCDEFILFKVQRLFFVYYFFNTIYHRHCQPVADITSFRQVNNNNDKDQSVQY